MPAAATTVAPIRVPRRWNRRTSGTETAAEMIVPTAIAVPCSPATAREVPCSSRSNGTAGPKP